MALETQESLARAKIIYLIDRGMDSAQSPRMRRMPWAKMILPDNDNEYIITLPPQLHGFWDGTVESFSEPSNAVYMVSGPSELEYSAMRPVPTSTLSAPTSGVMSGHVDSSQNDLHYFGGI